MQIRYTTLDKMNCLTNREMDFLLYIARFQDDYGNVVGICYKDLCANKREHLHMCKQTFYNVLRSLQDKGLITYAQRERGDYDIQILQNAAYNAEEKAPYININRKIFRSKEFIKMKAKEKFMLLDFMRSTACNHGKRIIGKGEFYKKYRKILNLSQRVIQQYLHTLKKYFLIFVKEGKYYINFLPNQFQAVTHGGRPLGAKEQRRKYLSVVLCRRCSVRNYTEKSMQELSILLRQYTTAIEESGYQVLQLFKSCLLKSVEEDPERKLNPAYVNKLINQCLA